MGERLATGLDQVYAENVARKGPAAVFELGFEAYKKGASLGDNPFDRRTHRDEHTLWISGFNEAVDGEREDRVSQ